jgi:hypothetical protein
MKKPVNYLILLAFLIPVYMVNAEEDASLKIASFIESKVNSDGFSGARCRSLGKDLVQCDIIFPMGTDKVSAIKNVEGVADLFGQIPMKATVFYTGYIGTLKVCEFKYDMYSRTITRKR